MSSTALFSAPAAATLQLDYLSFDQVASQPASWWHSVLGVVGFEKLPGIDRGRAPVTAGMVRSLSASDLCEVWRVGSGLQLSDGASASRVRYRYCDDLLFGSLIIAEQAEDGDAEALPRATETAYQEIFDVLNATEHRHLIRIWNYLPAINAQAAGDERYRRFNSARRSAFRQSGRTITETAPAASAVGSPAGSPLSICFLAARQPARMIENPRQISAYHYPAKFGRHSPIFSRACMWGSPAQGRLFISGTASIVGCETFHRGDVAAQTRETLVNINALLAEANRIAGAARYTLSDLKFKVYVRNSSDLPIIEATLEERLDARTSIVYLQADVCREDLLVEIEAVG